MPTSSPRTSIGRLTSYCGARGIAFCSSVFSQGEVDLLDAARRPVSSRSPRWISSTCPFSRYAARKPPMVISTGMATLGGDREGRRDIRGEGNEQIVLLHCVSIYPPEYDTIHLRNMVTLREAFDVPVGFSDHTLGTSIPLAAIALGACVIEKHFTLDKDMPGGITPYRQTLQSCGPSSKRGATSSLHSGAPAVGE